MFVILRSLLILVEIVKLGWLPKEEKKKNNNNNKQTNKETKTTKKQKQQLTNFARRPTEEICTDTYPRTVIHGKASGAILTGVIFTRKLC